MSVKDQIRSNWLIVALLAVMLLIILCLSIFAWTQFIELQRDYRAQIKELRTVAETANKQAKLRHDALQLDLTGLRQDLKNMNENYRTKQIYYQDELRKINQRHSLNLKRINALPGDSVTRELSELFSQF